MFFVYILFSISLKKYYIGHTENIENRLKRHNNGLVKSTKNGKPWQLVIVENYKTKNEAYIREMQIKSYKGGEAFKKAVNWGRL